MRIGEPQLRDNLHVATRTIRAKRAQVVAEVEDWEALREAGRAIKADAMRRLDLLLVELEEAVTAAGGGRRPGAAAASGTSGAA